MLLICILIVVYLEYHQKVRESDRRFLWYGEYSRWVDHRLSHLNWYTQWADLGVKVVLLPLVLGILLTSGEGFIFWLVKLALSTYILAHCIGPEVLRKKYSHYFDAMRRNDYEAAYLSMGENIESDDPSKMMREVSRLIIKQIYTHYFAMVVWFIVLGAPGALFYRLYRQRLMEGENGVLTWCSHWVEWVPSRISAVMLALAGNFHDAKKPLIDAWKHWHKNSVQIIEEVGISSLLTKAEQEEPTLDENRKAVDLAERSLLLVLVVASIMTIAGVIA